MTNKFYYPTLEQVLDLHEGAVKRFGGRFGMNDFTMLHSAIERPKATFGGQDLYPDIYTKAAALISSMILNHLFDDGNKRSALLTTMLFFHLNGYELTIAEFSAETYEFVLGIDLKKYDFAGVTRWLKGHIRKVKNKK